MLAELVSAPLVFFWHCVLCKNDCDGEKYCVTCGVATPVSI
ncbi:putative zinc ribbon protein [Citrobacter sp. FP75]